MKSTINRRRKARELALRALYALEMSGNNVESILEDMVFCRDEESALKEFTAQLVRVSAEKKTEIDKFVDEKSFNWDYERIAVLDKLIMRLAVAEFLFFEDIPPKVSMDEAIEIAKKYSTERSSEFINGILDGILLNLKKKNLLKKSGRGLNE